MKRAGQILRAVGLTLLGLVAAAGVLVAASGWVASTGFGSRMVARWMTAALEGVVAGRLTIGSLTVTPGGDVDLGSLEVVDPAGHPVIRVALARARLELGAWALKTVRVDLELEHPEVWLDPDAENGLTIATAFTPVGAAGQTRGGDPWSGWKIHVIRLRLRDGAVTWRGSGDRTWLVATGLEVNGAGTLQAAGIAAGLTLAGKVEVPLQGPLAIQLAAHIEGSRLTVPRLSLGAAGSRLEAFGEWDWERETFRAAASRLALAEKDLAVLAGQPVTGIDLEGRLYAESDGKRLTAAADLTAPDGAHGGGRVAMALWLGSGSPRSVGFDAALDQLDPARVLSRAPRGRVSFTGRGALTWPVPAPGRVSRGHATVDRLDVALPGLDLKGEGRWRDAGAMSGAFQLTASDLAAAGPAVEALLGVTLPALTGQAEANLTLAGTEAAPEVALVVRTPRSTVAEVLLTDGRAELKLSRANLELQGSTGLGLLDGAAVTVRSAATISPGWKGASFTQLEVGLAGQAWTLAAPASVTFDGPRVDRAELRSGAQRLALTGGLTAGGSADALLEVSELDLARLPRGLLPASLGPAGRIDGTLRLAGPAARRTLDAKVVSHGALASLAALSGFGLKAELAWRRQTGRVDLDAALRTTRGATLEVSANLPWPTAGAAQGVPVTGRVAAGGWQLQPLLRAVGTDLPADGRLAGELTLTGSAGSPRLAAQLSVTDGRWDDLAPLQLTASLEGTGPTLRAAAEVRLADGALAKGTVELPFDRGALLAHPGRTLGRLARAAWSAHLEVPGTDLAALAGKAGLPAGLTGRLSGEATLGGAPASPRGTGSFTLAEGSLAGYPHLGGRVSFKLEQARTAVEALLESDGVPALQLVASLAAPVEELGRADVQRRAALQLTAVIPKLTLPGSPVAAWSPAGQVAGKLDLTGTLAAPQGSLALDAAGLTLGGLPFGGLKGTARTADGATRFDVTLTPEGGGTLHAGGTLGLVPGILTTASALEAAPLRMVLTGHQLSVSFLPALLPGKLRAMSGAVETELTVTGSAQAPSLAGTLSVADVKATLPGLGTFTHVAFEASFGPETIRIKDFSAKHGKGRLEGNLLLEGLDGPEARLTGSLVATGFTVARSGMDVVTIDARAGLSGRYHERRLEAVVDVEKGATIRLPRKAPRELQSLENRPDIVVGKEPQPLAGNGSPGTAPGVASPDHRALEVSIRVRAVGLLVKSDKPRVHLEVRTDSTWGVTATPLQVAGTLDAVQGTFEPIGGRLFTVVRGHVAFSGGPLGTAQLDLAADHEAANVRVHATIGGTIETPSLQLTSEPPLDEATLAMLIVTGKTEMNVGGTQGPAFKAQDAGMAAAMAVANRAFEDQLGEKMPLDSLTLDSSSVTAGKQLTDRIRVNYVRRFDARPEKGENLDEVRVQYHLSPRWTLETRYGSSSAGGASLMWQKDY